VILNEEVFEAKIVCSAQTISNSLNNFSLASKFSIIASITKSEEDKLTKSIVPERFPKT
jgi:hypothetical protein